MNMVLPGRNPNENEVFDAYQYPFAEVCQGSEARVFQQMFTQNLAHIDP
jgi:hypothetical protein